MNSRSAIVLSVPHSLQGENIRPHVEDPSYKSLLEELIPRVNVIFEEAAGHCPTIAEKFADSLWGPGHYLDVDPPADQRQAYGLSRDTGKSYIIEGTGDSACLQYIAQHRKREELWLRKILERDFDSALVVCGSAHGLSFAFRLEATQDIQVNLHEYLPYHKLGKQEKS